MYPSDIEGGFIHIELPKPTEKKQEPILEKKPEVAPVQLSEPAKELMQEPAGSEPKEIPNISGKSEKIYKIQLRALQGQRMVLISWGSTQRQTVASVTFL